MTLSDAIHGRLIVSCQAGEDSPFRDPEVMLPMVRAAMIGGASAIRLESVAHVRAMTDLGVPLIGLIKRSEPSSHIYITPTTDDVVALAEAGADIVAMDATSRHRPQGQHLIDLVRTAHRRGVQVLGDINSLESARFAEDAGVDWIGTTLSGYVPPQNLAEPDLELIEQISRTCLIPIIAEGRYSQPAQVAAAFANGAWSVVVGTAISDPLRMTRRFVEACPADQRAEQEKTHQASQREAIG